MDWFYSRLVSPESKQSANLYYEKILLTFSNILQDLLLILIPEQTPVQIMPFRVNSICLIFISQVMERFFFQTKSWEQQEEKNFSFSSKIATNQSKGCGLKLTWKTDLSWKIQLNKASIINKILKCAAPRSVWENEEYNQSNIFKKSFWKSQIVT